VSVSITGIGACLSNAANAEELWSLVAEPHRGPEMVPVTTDEPGDAVCQAPVGDTYQVAVRLAWSAVGEAAISAGILDANGSLRLEAERLASTFSVSKPLFRLAQTPQQIAPLCQAPLLVQPDRLVNEIWSRVGGAGERRNVIAACATGPYAVALGAQWIEAGLCDVVIAGSVEAPIHPLYEAGFRQMGVVSREPRMRPFDRHRSGFIFNSGAGVVILESEAHAQKRGVTPLARLSGWGLGSDPHSAVAFNSNGRHIADVIGRAIARAGLSPEDIQHVNAHGTATRLNDWIETQALLKAFGPHASALMISGTKSATGHLLGAAGSVELVLSVLALQNQFVPPTQQLDQPDPECPLDYTPRQGHAATIDHALSLSFGFGGPIGALVVSRP
jgi:3-oxoacyl-[acyl-carrier-protein] synthase II